MVRTCGFTGLDTNHALAHSCISTWDGIMDKVTEQFGELLKIPEPSARYLLALFIGWSS